MVWGGLLSSATGYLQQGAKKVCSVSSLVIGRYGVT